MADYALQVGAAQFWQDARQDIAAARRRVLVQAMTFEGDRVGKAVAAAVTASQAPDRRILVDDYTRHVINDRILVLTRDPAIQEEARATRRMFARLVEAGVGVRVTQPIQGQPLRYPARNHQKLLVIDNVAWLGGINFSDHNFAWHDAMLRIANAEVADWLAVQFAADWAGDGTFAQAEFNEGLKLLKLSGRDNRRNFAPVLEAFAGAQRSLEVISPYPTFPFLGAMGHAVANGARVVLYTSRGNNKPIVRDYAVRAARRYGIEVRLTPGMSHAKAALVDGRRLIMGSSNFDFVSARVSSELVALIADAGLVGRAERTLFAPLRKQAEAMSVSDFRPWRGRWAAAALHLADFALGSLPHRPRTIDWPRLAEGDPPG